MNEVLLDVRLGDDFGAEHLEGAANQPVFEVQFPAEISSRFPERSTAFTVYGASEASLEAAMAVEKLGRLGYTNVEILEGGFEGAVSNGVSTVKGDPLPNPPLPLDGKHEVDVTESEVMWTGRNLLNKHHGTVGLQTGSLEFRDGHLVGGELVLDLRQLHCADLKGSDLHDVLIDHLHNDDFLDLENFPTAILRILGSKRVSEHSGAPNLSVEAELTIKGKTLPLQFEATAGQTPEGKAAAQAAFAIDRTDWGINYGSGKLFHRLAGHLVNDLIEFQVKIVTQ